ncbi:MAG: hypothetical protein QY330_03955 [Candidatus Dojkabacteria bacterium]|uniref:Uncharacterized protein n=1 Tax=Candidatus Dojkabacteria bacterium TaxID=2099670 RepID=A0A952AJC1_9BACT|nr:hypothetical protein [Candidatus Dojkabacteria bacterium]WKZ27676.1 MAG: hypothetical protein QY330_03955 [Candidatus Dojkabacteria bacterium]
MLTKSRKLLVLIGIIVAIGVVLRLVAASVGYNYDFESYKIVADIVLAGGNVYSETARYNYGPVWFIILGTIAGIANLTVDPELAFRVGVVLLLTFSDLVISFILYKRYGLFAGIFFFLNPISIIITGFHSQFDNLAIAVGMVAVLIYSQASDSNNRRLMVAALVLLGVSIMVKHVLVFFPIWLFIREKTFVRKGASLAIPLLVFFAGFVPFLSAFESIRENVFLYDSARNAPILRSVMPPIISSVLDPKAFMAIGLILSGLLTRKKALFEQLLWYLLLVVIFSMSILHHYLVIPMAFIAVYPNIFWIIYILISGFIFTLDKLGMGIEQMIAIAPQQFLFIYSTNRIYDIPMLFLFLGLCTHLIFSTQGKLVQEYQARAFRSFRQKIGI